MKNKISLLIILSIITLIALSAIQGYLVYNSYKLEKDVFISETIELVGEIGNDDRLDSLFVEVWEVDLSNHLADYLNNRIEKEEVLSRFDKRAMEISPAYNAYYKQLLDSINLAYNVRYKKVLLEIVLFENGKLDTIFSTKNGSEMKLFGENIGEEDVHSINKTTRVTEFSYIDSKGDMLENKLYDVEIRTESFMEIKGWEQIVIQRMANLLIISLLLFLFIVGLLYYSIKNLITQKKITDIKTDFINNMTHELKTPLATLAIASKSLKKEEIKNNEEAFINTIDIIDRQNGRLQKLIDQVMTNSLTAEQIVLRKEEVMDSTYFKHLIEDFKHSIQHKTIVIKEEIHVTEIWFRIDTFHFTTALFNILDNAVKYGEEKVKIEVKTTLKNNNYVITISDDGIGISEKKQTQIFDKFYRVSEGDVHNVKGLGLGLYYTYQIIKAHGGAIQVQSEIGKGSKFIISIPIN